MKKVIAILRRRKWLFLLGSLVGILVVGAAWRTFFVVQSEPRRLCYALFVVFGGAGAGVLLIDKVVDPLLKMGDASLNRLTK